MFVLGTAGHVDHGKSLLVQALTGIDPDRLREEKERGMTIDLGFAWVKLPGGREVGVVDVPGHERFVKNMLAGVGGIDLALLVVAANEGVMPQTREHLAILDLLGIPGGIVVITKKDLVDEEWLTLVKMDIAELIRGTILSGAPTVAVSALTGEGLPELLAAIDAVLARSQPKKDLGRPRLPVDRVFTIAGAGTVVTGTLLDGSLSVGQEVEIVPPHLMSRIRGLQTHKARVDTAGPGTRVAANLVGVTTAQLQRGYVLASLGWLRPTTLATAHLQLLPRLRRPLRHNAAVSFHTGAAEAMAKVRLLDSEQLSPGESCWAQLSLAAPVAVVNGDRFIIRSPVETLGGGKVIDSQSARLRRFRPAVIDNLKARAEGKAEENLLALVAAKEPVELSALVAQCGLPRLEAESLVEELVRGGRVVKVGQKEPLLLTAAGWQGLSRKVVGVVQEYHQRFPARAGIPRVELGNKLKLGARAADVLQRLLDDGALSEEGLVVRLPQHQVRLSQPQQVAIAAFLKSLAENPYAPPGQVLEPDLLSLLVERRQVVKVGDGIVFSAAAYNEMVARVTARIREHGKVTLAEVRDMFQTSRKYAQAFLEHLDSSRITRRVGDERVLWK